VAAVSALAILGTTGAQASIIAGSAAGGSEAILSVVNAAGDSISQDLGEQAAAINAGDNYSLSASVLSFISAAGGAANVTYGMIAGTTGTRNYLTGSASSTFADDVIVGNGAKGLWAGTINGLVGDLNLGDGTPTSTNLTYGAFATGSGSPNYLDGLYDSWQSGDFQYLNLASGLDTLYLYTTTFAIANTGTVPFTAFKGGLFANLNLSTNQLEIGPAAVVPVPAAVWLFGSALGLLGVSRRRSAATS
jgi:hypothetical protein